MEKQVVFAEVNRRDYLGRTVLHLAVMEKDSWALDWVELLLKVPGIQVNLPDLESGWTALHRALYSGVRLSFLFQESPFLTLFRKNRTSQRPRRY